MTDMNKHLFSLADHPQQYKVSICVHASPAQRQQVFSSIYRWLSSMRGLYHVDWADLPTIIYSFSDEVDAVSFKLSFG